MSLDAAAVLSNATFAPMIDLEVLRAYQVVDQVTLALGGKNDPAFGGGPLHLTGHIMHISEGASVGDGPVMGGLAFNFGPTAVLRGQMCWWLLNAASC